MSDIMIHTSNPAGITCVSNVFIDTYMKEANGEYVKIYLYLLRCLGQREVPFSIPAMADKLEYTEADIRRALAYWERQGLLRLERDPSENLRGICLLDPPGVGCVKQDTAPSQVAEASAESPEAVPAQRQTPAAEEPELLPAPRSYTREERDALRSDPNLEEILFLAERYIRHPLSSQDMESIIYWYDGLKLPADLIEYLIESCVDKGHASIHYMNKVALNWAANHFSTVEEAKQSASIHSQAYYAVMKAFGISGRSLAEAESAYVEKWTKTYGFTLDIITEACKRTILNIQKPSFQYADTLLTSWHSQKVHHLEDIARLDKANAGKPAKKSEPKGGGQNRFHNFSQRQYDYDALEQQLLQK